MYKVKSKKEKKERREEKVREKEKEKKKNKVKGKQGKATYIHTYEIDVGKKKNTYIGLIGHTSDTLG